MDPEFLSKEYFTIVDIIKDFDQRLMTIKGWGVTLSLVALGLGFQEQQYGLFLIACLSSGAFWFMEGVVKKHQMRYYVRMREIEIFAYEQHKAGNSIGIATPQIDWGWARAEDVMSGKDLKEYPIQQRKPSKYYHFPWRMFHVMVPHIIGVIVGAIFFLLGASGKLNPPGQTGPWVW